MPIEDDIQHYRPSPSALPWAVLIAGPTSSGKSALALHIARLLKGTIINADSMQVYRDLRILTARPTVEDESEIPHRLYGVLPASQTGSVAWWRKAVLAEIDEVVQQGRLPIICGGTGMYFNALIKGLSLIPDPDPAMREESRAILHNEGSHQLHKRLQEVDPKTAQRLHPSDSQRLARAWEIWRSTGKSITEWQLTPGLPAAPYRFAALRLAPTREVLKLAIAQRFETMLAHGAVEEVKALAQQGLTPELPIMRAHGVPELMSYLQGNISCQEAASLAVQATFRYTKRQATWFAHHALAEQGCYEIFAWNFPSNTQQMENIYNKSISFIIKTIDA